MWKEQNSCLFSFLPVDGFLHTLYGKMLSAGQEVKGSISNGAPDSSRNLDMVSNPSTLYPKPELVFNFAYISNKYVLIL